MYRRRNSAALVGFCVVTVLACLTIGQVRTVGAAPITPGETNLGAITLVDSVQSLAKTADTTIVITGYGEATRTPNFWVIYFASLTTGTPTNGPRLVIKSKVATSGQYSNIDFHGQVPSIVDSTIIKPKIVSGDTVGAYAIVRPVGAAMEFTVVAGDSATKAWIWKQESREQ